MNLTPALYRNAPYYFVAFTLIVAAGFWVYFVNPVAQRGSQVLVHLHAATMSLWCLMLILQAYLIRTNRRSLHRQIGKSSFVLVPIIVALQVAVVPHFIAVGTNRVGPEGVTDGGMLAMSYILGNALVFSLLYALAIVNRRAPAIHARLMICSVLPLLGPATDRIILRNPWFAQYLPTAPTGGPWQSVAAFAIADITVFLLAVWDWKSHRRLNLFPPVLLLFFAHQVFIGFSYRVPIWRDFCNWFMGET